MKRTEAEKEVLAKKLAAATPEERSKILDDFLGVVAKTPLQKEVAEIWKEIKENDAVGELGIKLISKLKAGVDGRGAVPEKELNQRRRVFTAATKAAKE